MRSDSADRSAPNNGRRLRPPVELCRQLSDSLDQLQALCRPGGEQQGGLETSGGSAPSSATVPEEDVVTSLERGAEEPGPAGPAPPTASQHEALQRSISEEVQQHLQGILESLEESAELAERGDSPEGATPELLIQFLAVDLPARLVASLVDLQFEVRKHVISIFNVLVRFGPNAVAADSHIQDYARRTPRFFSLLVEGYARPEIATHCGMMLRSCARHRQLVAAFLDQPAMLQHLLTFTSKGSFDVTSDAFSSLHDLLLMHKDVSAAFLEAHFQEFFRLYNALLQPDDYVTQRQALKLLSEILLDRTFMRVMLMYIGEEQFLQIHMNLLRSDSKVIQFEAFHVFKIFVANPQKPPKVQLILHKNKEKLVRLLETLAPNRPDDKQFAEDRVTVIGKLQNLEAPLKREVSSSAQSGGGSPVAVTAEPR